MCNHSTISKSGYKRYEKSRVQGQRGGIKMATLHFMQTVGLILLAGLLVIGFMYEPMIAKWEQKQKRKVLRALKVMRRYRR